MSGLGKTINNIDVELDADGLSIIINNINMELDIDNYGGTNTVIEKKQKVCEFNLIDNYC